MLLGICAVHSFVLLGSFPSSLPFPLGWFILSVLVWLSHVEGSLAHGTHKVYLLCLPE